MTHWRAGHDGHCAPTSCDYTEAQEMSGYKERERDFETGRKTLLVSYILYAEMHPTHSQVRYSYSFILVFI